MSAAKEALMSAIDSLGLTLDVQFVPWSKSRNANKKDPSLNWSVTLKRADRAILTTDYSAGVGHCPSYKHGDRSEVQRRLVGFECESGVRASYLYNTDTVVAAGSGGTKPLLPDICDVVYSLVSDSDVLNCSTFEEWASDHGYDTDSRKAEATYRACLEIALALRLGVGEDGLKRLAEVCQGY